MLPFHTWDELFPTRLVLKWLSAIDTLTGTCALRRNTFDTIVQVSVTRLFECIGFHALGLDPEIFLFFKFGWGMGWAVGFRVYLQ